MLGVYNTAGRRIPYVCMSMHDCICMHHLACVCSHARAYAYVFIQRINICSVSATIFALALTDVLTISLVTKAHVKGRLAARPLLACCFLLRRILIQLLGAISDCIHVYFCHFPPWFLV